MNVKNICKFAEDRGGSSLAVEKFILETQPQPTENPLKTDRMILVCEGNGFLLIDGERIPAERGDLAVLSAGQRFASGNPPPFRYLYIDYAGERAGELASRFGIGRNRFLFHGLTGLIPIWSESLARAGNGDLDLVGESMLLYAFSLLGGSETVRRDPVTAVTDYLSEHYYERSLSLGSVADALGYNAKYLSHLTARKLGVGFREYLTEVRLKQAILLMGQGVTSVKNVSLLCGFSDPLYFSKVFRRRFGVSPTDYIRSREQS